MDRWALFSVSDKTGSAELGRWFLSQGIGVLASGGTYRFLEENGVAATSLESITGFDQVLGGRVKTLHPAIYAGLLSRRTKDDQADVTRIGAPNIVAAVVNLYPFRSKALQKVQDFSLLVEEIDIGGVSLIRAAAKNYAHVMVLIDPKQYPSITTKEWNGFGIADRRQLAVTAFRHAAAYDAAIAQVLGEHEEALDLDWVAAGIVQQELRYGENPHQSASFYHVEPRSGFAGAQQYQGKELSYNNLADADAAWGLVRSLAEPAAVVIKHQNPAAAAVAPSVEKAFELAYQADPVSIFGGIVAFNTMVTKTVAEKLKDIFLEVVLAPKYDAAALEVLGRKKNLRVLKMPQQSFKPWDVRMIDGGLLVQTIDREVVTLSDWQQVAGPKTALQAWERDACLAWSTVRWAKSNAIVLARDGVTRGIGSGQTNRIDAAKQAISRAGDASQGAILASDAFFPFGDVMAEAAQAKVKVVIQPGGSHRDQESIDAANQFGIALFFTKERHFRH